MYEYDGEGKRVRKINDGTETIPPYEKPEGARRFGEGHDGEHRNSTTPGVDIKAIAGLTGTVIHTFLQNKKFGNYSGSPRLVKIKDSL